MLSCLVVEFHHETILHGDGDIGNLLSDDQTGQVAFGYGYLVAFQVGNQRVETIYGRIHTDR